MTGGTVQYNRDGMESGFAELTAIPFDGYTFKHFVLSDTIVTENPFVTDATGVDAVFFVSALDYLKSVTRFVILDNALVPISLKRKFDLRSDILLLDEKMRELATADLYVYLASSPSSFTGTVEKDFYWEHREGSYAMLQADRNFFLRLANEIYTKYGESKRGTTITLINL